MTRTIELSELMPAGAPRKTNMRNGMARKDRIPLEDRHFIVWDGEGAKGLRRHQEYVLFGCSTGDKIIKPSLSTLDCLELIIQVGKEHPKAWHCGFAFDYDTNMIIRDLSVYQLKDLRDKGHCYHAKGRYRIEHIPHKWFQVTDYGHSNRKNERVTVRINDTFGFYQMSFVKAIQTNIPNHRLMADLATIEQGKAERNNFTFDKIDYIDRYWSIEIQLLLALVDNLREMLYRGGFYIKQWHGPGALANYTYNANGISGHKQPSTDAVYDAARYGYAGGRFELFRVGRFGRPDRKVYSYDINSAYPAAIAELPSLTEGFWKHQYFVSSTDAERLAEFGIYHLRLTGPKPLMYRPAPLFHRDEHSCISYPWMLEGWYWTPEVTEAIKAVNSLNETGDGPAEIGIIEGWEYLGWETRPFDFVKDAYNERKKLKAAGDGTQMAYKLMLNSLYGKMAQRVGWERTGEAPKWHQLDWAGYVTSETRARLFEFLNCIPDDDLIGVETDGIYTTMSPDELGITDGKDLGDWEINCYDEMYYIQSGMYFLRDGEKWIGKYRGLDAGTLTPQMMKEHLQNLEPDSEWPGMSGYTTRFTGYKKALWMEEHHMGPTKTHMNTWTTSEKVVRSGVASKRVHLPKLCPACGAGKDAFDMPHQLTIRPGSMQNYMSYPHDIPWLSGDTAEWREHFETFGDDEKVARTA